MCVIFHGDKRNGASGQFIFLCTFPIPSVPLSDTGKKVNCHRYELMFLGVEWVSYFLTRVPRSDVARYLEWSTASFHSVEDPWNGEQESRADLTPFHVLAQSRILKVPLILAKPYVTGEIEPLQGTVCSAAFGACPRL